MSIWRVAAGIPASFADSIEDFVGLFNLDTWEGMYNLLHRDDVLEVLGKSVVDEYTARLERYEENYQKGGIKGAYAAGVEQGKLLTELTSLVAPGGALEKIGTKVASVAGKATLETTGRIAGRGAHTADHVEDAAKAGDNLADLERKTDLPEHRDSTAGRETGHDGHTNDDVATSTNEPRTSDNASSVGQNEASNHSGVESSAGVVNSGFKPVETKSGLTFDSNVIDGEIEIVTRQKFIGGNIGGEIKDTKFDKAFIFAKFDESTGDLFIRNMRVDQKGNGIGTELISNAIESVGADRVRSVSAQLADTNKDVFDFFKSERLNDIDAFSNTPLGKSLNKLGFKNLDAQNQYPFPLIKASFE